MENTTRLLQRQEHELANRHVLIVDNQDPALTSQTLHAASVSIHSDTWLRGDEQWAMLPTYRPHQCLIILSLNKSLQRMQFVLHSLASQLSSAVEIWLVGPSKGGIKGALKHFDAVTEGRELVDAARHCKLYRGKLQPISGNNSEQKFSQQFAVNGHTFTTLPGIFNHGALDAGSALLLKALSEQLTPLRNGHRALDIGCGSGCLAVYLAGRGSHVTAVDISATAVHCTTINAARNGQQSRVSTQASDMLSEVTGRFDLIVTNPPFHDGRSRTLTMTESMIAAAPARLASNGQLWMVANRELAYADALHKHFKRVDVVAEDNRFKVYRCD